MGKATRGITFLNQEANKTGMVQRLAACKVWSSKSTEWPVNGIFVRPRTGRPWNAPKAWSNMWLWRDPADWNLALACCLYKAYTMTTASCWPSTPPWKEFRVEIRNKALCALGKTQKNRPSESQMFSGKDFYEPNFLHLLVPRETLMSQTSV